MSKSKEQLLKEFNEKVEDAKISFDSYLKDLMTDLSNELKKIDDEKKKRFKVDLPENDTEVYYINDYDNTICIDDFQESSEDDETRFRNGMLFESAEEAEKFLKERRLLFTIQEWAKIHNEGWTPDWNSDIQNKYYIEACVEEKSLAVRRNVWHTEFSRLPYFKTADIARKCIEEFGEEIKEILL